MIIEPAIHLAMMRLMDRKDCTDLREEHLSYVLASSCEDLLKDFQSVSASNQVVVELYYPGTASRCDVFVDLSSLRFPNNIYQHHIFCECKYFRRGSTNNVTKNLVDIWADFSQVVNLGKSIGYVAVLCENEWDKLILRNDASITCFASNSPSSFSLYETAAPANPEDKMQINGPGTEYKILRNYTEAFELKFGDATRLFRIYLFRLWVKGKNSDDFQFEELK